MRVFMKGTSRVSNGMRDLARAMGVRRIHRTNSRYVPRSTDVLINWGQSGEDYDNVPTWINKPSAVGIATRKRTCFDMWALSGIPTVSTTGDKLLAANWAMEDGSVMHRSLNCGSQGRGISIHETHETLPDGGFFCRLFGNEENREFRVHVMGGEAIDITQKRRRSRKNGYEGVIDPTVRSSSNGWVFCRSRVECPESLEADAIKAVQALGLDFGAVDCAVNDGTGERCIYEVNTAPGVEGTTHIIYTERLKRLVESGVDATCP